MLPLEVCPSLPTALSPCELTGAGAASDFKGHDESWEDSDVEVVGLTPADESRPRQKRKLLRGENALLRNAKKSRTLRRSPSPRSAGSDADEVVTVAAPTLAALSATQVNHQPCSDGDDGNEEEEVQVVRVCPQSMPLRSRAPSSASVAFVALMGQPDRASIVFRLLPTATDIRSTLVALGAGLRREREKSLPSVSCAVAGAAYRLLCERVVSRDEALALYRQRRLESFSGERCVFCEGSAISRRRGRVLTSSVFSSSPTSSGLPDFDKEECGALWRSLFFSHFFGVCCELCGESAQRRSDGLGQGGSRMLPSSASGVSLCADCRAKRVLCRRDAERALRRVVQDEAVLLRSQIRRAQRETALDKTLPRLQTNQLFEGDAETAECFSTSDLAKNLSSSSAKAVRNASVLGGLFVDRGIFLAFLRRHWAATARLKRKVLKETLRHWTDHFGMRFVNSHFADLIKAEETAAGFSSSCGRQAPSTASASDGVWPSSLVSKSVVKSVSDSLSLCTDADTGSEKRKGLASEEVEERLRRATLRGMAVVALLDTDGGEALEETHAPLRLRVVGPSRATHFIFRIQTKAQTEGASSKEGSDDGASEEKVIELSLLDLSEVAAPFCGDLNSLTRRCCQTVLAPLLRIVLSDIHAAEACLAASCPQDCEEGGVQERHSEHGGGNEHSEATVFSLREVGLSLEDFFCACAALHRLAYRCFRLTRHPDMVSLDAMFREWTKSELSVLHRWLRRLQKSLPSDASAAAALCAAGAEVPFSSAGSAVDSRRVRVGARLALRSKGKTGGGAVEITKKPHSETHAHAPRGAGVEREGAPVSTTAPAEVASEEEEKNANKRNKLSTQDVANSLYAAFLLECLWSFLFNSKSQAALRPVTCEFWGAGVQWRQAVNQKRERYRA